MAEPPTPYSVIVPVHNGAETLDTCLTALTGQDYPGECFEVIVVDDGSTDETAQIVARYAVRLIRLGSNRGRIVARNTGAQAARFETLVFNDAGVTPGAQLLARVNQKNYQPLMPETDDYDGSRWGYGRFFFLLRSRLYAPYYPAPEDAGEYMITPENFDAVPKGTGCFVCDRSLWLQNQPAVQDKFTSDDTRILREIVEHRPIVRLPSIRVRYRQRTGIESVLRHVLQRGPLFADYYLRPGGRHFVLYTGLWGFILLSLLLAGMNPSYGMLPAGLTLTALAGAVVYLSRCWSDILVVAVCLPTIAAAFGLGILKWQIRQLLGRG
jgi:hypothetical protein